MGHGEEDGVLDPITEGIVRAINLILSGDPEVYAITALSLFVSICGTLLSCIWSIPISAVLAFRNLPGKRALKGLFNASDRDSYSRLGLVLVLAPLKERSAWLLSTALHTVRHHNWPMRTGYSDYCELHY